MNNRTVDRLSHQAAALIVAFGVSFLLDLLGQLTLLNLAIWFFVSWVVFAIVEVVTSRRSDA
jgi:hypothetical protein